MAAGDTLIIQSQPGIQRDGTSIDAGRWNDGQWVRFRRARPKKMNGYREVTAFTTGPARAVYVWTRQDTIQLTTFSDCGVEAVQVDKNGIGANIIDRTPAGWVDTPGLTWSVDTMFDAAAGANKTLLLAHCAPSMANIDDGATGEIYWGDANGTEPLTPIGNNTAVSGGIVVLHPYLVRFGSDGLVSWSNANEPRSWPNNQPVGGDAGTARVTGAKIVKGMPVRGEGQSPNGLLWSLDSVIRMVYVGGAAIFKFDPVSGASSILSAQSVVEYDGTFFWIGTDRFLAYNGQIQEVPNDTNQLDFFDNLNYEQRQKVFGIKVPKYGEIWWFYPRGTATECNHAIIFNVREKCWYDTPLSRSAGASPKVFRWPMLAGGDVNAQVVKLRLSNPSGQFLPGDHVTCNSGAIGIVRKVLGNTVFVEPGNADPFVLNEVLANASRSGTGTISVAPFTTELHSLWQHEIGRDKVQGDRELAIPAFIETADFGFPTGGPGDSGMGKDVWTRIKRIEPDFVQSETMTVQIVGQLTPNSPMDMSPEYPFEPTTEKIDFREQRRLIRIRFASNAAGGDFEMGRCIAHIEQGDTRS